MIPATYFFRAAKVVQAHIMHLPCEARSVAACLSRKEPVKILAMSAKGRLPPVDLNPLLSILASRWVIFDRSADAFDPLHAARMFFRRRHRPRHPSPKAWPTLP